METENSEIFLKIALFAFGVIFCLIYPLGSFCMPMPLGAETNIHLPLFKIERNKNANVIQYDGQIDSEGNLLKKEPVIAYWVRLAEQGQKKKLSWAQKTFAFGFKVKPGRKEGTVMLDMKLDIGRMISISREGENYRATIPIDGAVSYLDRIFIHATGKGIKTTVDYFEFHGKEVKTGDSRFEKFVP
jgi:hypothetical protein